MLDKLLITGASGQVARLIRADLDGLARTIRYTDLTRPDDLPDSADFLPCDLSRMEEVSRVVAGCDGILHLGGISVEDSFDRILEANIRGVQNLYEAARQNGRPRILFASSNHVTGFYPRDVPLDTDAPHRPDTWYGVSKSFGEAVALMYFHKVGQESALVRIGSCLPEPRDHRMLSTWLAPADFVSLIARVFAVPTLGCPVIYGVSANDAAWWDNSAVAYLGWQPQHNAAVFADRFAAPDSSARSPADRYQGGAFVEEPIHGG